MQHKRPQALLFLRVPRTRAQEQDTEARELSFLERLALLVDRQWNWRQNQALARRLHAAKLRGNACVEDIDFRASRGLDKSAIRALVHESASVRNHEHLFARLEWERVSLRARWLRKPAGWILPSVHSGRGAVSRSTAKLSRIGVFVIEGDGAAERARGALRRPVSNRIHDRSCRWRLGTSRIGDPTVADGIHLRLRLTSPAGLVLEADAKNPTAFELLARDYLAQNQPRRALDAGRMALSLDPQSWLYRVELTTYLSRAGKAAEALHLLAQILHPKSPDESNPLTLAGMYARMGDRFQTIFNLEAAVRVKASDLGSVRFDPAYDFVHDDPRFQSIVAGTQPK